MPQKKPKTDDLERRLATRPLLAERREDDAAEGEPGEDRRVLRGYAALFNTPTVIWDMFEEEIAPGAFASALTDADVRALWNHDPREVLGRTKAGTLELQEDEVGLAVVIYPPDTERGRDRYESVRRGDVTQMSFAFRAIREEWIERGDGELPIRRLLECELYEVSPVTFPAYEATEISARSAAEAVISGRRNHAARAALQRMRMRVRIAAAE